MCIFSFLILLIFLFIYYYSLKSKIIEVEESIHGRLSSVESKIDEVNVILYRLGDGINSLHSTKSERKIEKAPTKPEGRRKGSTGRKRPDTSAQMKARWAEKKRLRASAEEMLKKIEEQLEK